MEETRIFLSSVGRGDYANIYWYGNLYRPDKEILAEFRKSLNKNDVDFRDQSDEELISRIQRARRDKQEMEAESQAFAEDLKWDRNHEDYDEED